MAALSAGELQFRTQENVPFDEGELEEAVQSLKNVATGYEDAVDWAALKQVIAEVAHPSHKDWPSTATAADRLGSVLGGCSDAPFRSMFARVLEGGGWDAAEAAATARIAGQKPWAVLVSGVNGIRKTTSIYQPWFPTVLAECVGASDATSLPTGGNTFFRQLDFMVATLANQAFQRLYEIEDVTEYAALKAAIFGRYRTLAEVLGAHLVKEAKARGISLMLETSGRDVGMFEYIDYFFEGEDAYEKLVLRFTINELGHAEASVDRRMIKEMADGRAALAAGDARARIAANAGGPYGSAVLRGVQEASDSVWRERVVSGDVGASWKKAEISIEAHAEKEWTASAVGVERPSAFAFERLS